MQSPVSMPLSAALDDIPAVAGLQYEACAADLAFSTIFPVPPTGAALAHLSSQYEALLNDDPNASITIIKDTQNGDIMSYAIYHFIPTRSVEEVEEERLSDVAASAFPPDANFRLGQTLIKKSIRKRNEIVSECFGVGVPYVYLAAVGTDPRYQRLGAASRLVEQAVEQARDRNLPMYVESTPSALQLYLKFGFQEHDRLILNLRPMKDVDVANICLVRLAPVA